MRCLLGLDGMYTGGLGLELSYSSRLGLALSSLLIMNADEELKLFPSPSGWSAPVIRATRLGL